jgi:hypothetical protein
MPEPARTPPPLDPGVVGPAAPGPQSPSPSEPPVEAPADTGGVAGAVQEFVTAAAQRAATVVRPEAAAAIATGFGFPLILMLAVIAYLGVQGRIDYHDPKLRAAPQSWVETLDSFEEEA